MADEGKVEKLPEKAPENPPPPPPPPPADTKTEADLLALEVDVKKGK